MKIYIIQTTYPTLESALILKDKLLNDRLASCIQIHEIMSFYRWEGEICEDSEFKIDIKTSKKHYKAIKSLINATNPYEIPQIIEFKVKKTSKPYQKWHKDSIK